MMARMRRNAKTLLESRGLRQNEPEKLPNSLKFVPINQFGTNPFVANSLTFGQNHHDHHHHHHHHSLRPLTCSFAHAPRNQRKLSEEAEGEKEGRRGNGARIGSLKLPLSL